MSVYLKLKQPYNSVPLSFPNAGSTLRITAVSFSRTVSFLKNMELNPNLVLLVVLLQK